VRFCKNLAALPCANRRGDAERGDAESQRGSGDRLGSERRDDEEVLQLQSGDGHTAAEVGQIVLVAPTDLLDETMEAQAFEDLTDLRRGVLGQHTQMLVADAGEKMLAAHELLEKILIPAGEEVEALVCALVFPGGLAGLAEVFDAGTGIVEVGKKGAVTQVGGQQQGT